MTSSVTPGQMAEARRDLGRQLATWRAAAGLTQMQLARLTCYSRSAVANVEGGRQSTGRRFWQRADTSVGAAGALLAAFDQVDAVVQAAHRRTAQAREAQRQQRTARLAPAAPVEAEACGCTVTVSRWTGRETRALREALRMSLRAFAEHLGVNTGAAASWERRTAPTLPRLATQAVLDQALKLADDDTRHRFRKILDDLRDNAASAVNSSPHADVPGASVTPMRRPGRAREAS